MPVRDVILNVIGRESVTPAMNRAAAATEGAAARMTRASERMITAGRSLTHGLTLPIIAIGAVSVKMATDFNSAMTKIQTQAGASARDVKLLSDQVLSLAKYAEQGPVELADSLYHLKSVGLDNVDAMKALKQASDLASVGGADLEETTNALAGAWRTGIQGATNFHQAVSTVNAVIGAGNMRMEDFTAALSTGILPSAKTFGLTLKDVGAALAVFTDESVPADAAATRLRMSFSLLGAPSGAAEKQLATIGLTGLKLAQDMRKPEGLITAIGDLKTHLDDSGLSAAKQSQLLSRAFGGGRSSSAILGLINNYDVLLMKQEQVTRSMGKFDDAVAAQRATPEARFKLMESSLQRTAILIGTDLLPVAESLAHGIGNIAEAFNDLSPGTRKFIIEAGLAAAAVGPILLVGGKLIRVFGTAWRVMTFPSRMLFGWSAAGRTMTATGTAATGSAEQVSLATLKFNASQLSQQSAAERASAVIAVAEANKARAAVGAAEAIAGAARAAGGAESVLAERAATDARLFAEAKALEADAAVKSAAIITTSSMQATQALGRQQASMAPMLAMQRRQRMSGVGMGAGFGLMMGGQAVGGQAGRTMSNTGTGLMIGSMLGPEGAVAGAAIGAMSSAVDTSPLFGEAFKGVEGAAAIDKQVQGLSKSMRFSVSNADAYKAALDNAFNKNTPEATAHLKQVTTGLIQQVRASQQSTTTMEQLANGTADLTKISNTAGDAIVSLSDAISNLDHGMLSLVDSNLSFKLGLKDLPAQLKKGADGITGTSKAALTHRQALVGFLGQIKNIGSEMDAAGRKAPAVEKALNAHVAALRHIALASGVGAKEWHALLVQMNLTKPQIHTELIANTTSAMAKVTDLQTLLNNLANGAYVAHVNVTSSGQPFGSGDTHITNPGKSGGGHFAAGGTVPDGWFTVGEGDPHTWELGHKQGGNLRIFSNPQSRAMTGVNNVPGYANGSAPRGGKHKIVLGSDTIRQLKAALDGHIQEVVLAEMDY